MAFDYQFQADFVDGSSWSQADDDEAVLTPGKSSFMDFVTIQEVREPARIRLMGAHVLMVDLEAERFHVDGVEVVPGSKLPEGVEWIPKSEHPVLAKKAIYFRNVQRDGQTGELVGMQHCVGFLKDGVKRILGVR